MSVATPVGLAAGAAAGVAAGVPLGVVAGFAAEYLYVKYRHVAPTNSPVELTQVTGHASEANDETTPLLTDRPEQVTPDTVHESIKDTTPVT